MTPKGTGERQEPQTVKGVANEPRITVVEFRTDEAQLLGLWMVTRLLGEIRGIEQRVHQAELLTKAQILLTAFVLGFRPARPHREPVSARW
jgi:hypothetical protein